jgi:hypothetical protein
MADVSVRFQVAGDAEVVLNLSMPQAVRLMEAIARKVGEAMGQPARQAVGAGWGDTTGTLPDRRPPA